jgi:ABC-type phosphate/phosphonate transport system substrate-binding protein
MSEQLVEKLREAFIQFDEFKGIDTLVTGFVESNDNKYDVIRAVKQNL